MNNSERILPLVCPNCTASFHLEQGRRMSFCPHCGTQLLVDDGVRRVHIDRNTQHTLTDEAAIEKERTEQLRLQLQFANEEAKRAAKERRQKTDNKLLGVAWAVIIGFILILFIISKLSG